MGTTSRETGEAGRGRGARGVFAAALKVFAAALAVRGVFLLELRGGSYLGNARVSDAGEYFALASRILDGSAPAAPFWQAPLYPYLLAGFQALAGDALGAAQGLHLLVGAANCALLFALSDALFGRRVAWIAAAGAVLYAPFWLFDVQPLPTAWTTGFTLLAVVSFERSRTTAKTRWLAVAGASLGAALLTHGLAVFTLPVFVAALWRGRDAVSRARSARTRDLIVFLAATCALPAAASVRNSLAAGTPMFTSHNIGINLYIGNQPDLDRTLSRRTGYEWEAFFVEPRRQGITGGAELSAWFVDRTLAAWREAPAALFQTALRKAALVFAGSELKRNFPIEPLRADSRLLGAFLWQLDAAGRVVFAFPTGVVLPLALLGYGALRSGRCRVPVPLAAAALPAWIAAAYAVGMVVFFPATRYRVTAMALAIPYAAIAGVVAWDALARREWPRRLAVVGAVAAFLIVNPIASNVYRHPDRDRAEHLYYEARWAMQQLARNEDPSLEVALVSKAEAAMRVDPTYPEPVELLAAFYLTRDLERARAHFDAFSDMVPPDAEGRVLLGRILIGLEREN